jgi:hypothetical protein
MSWLDDALAREKLHAPKDERASSDPPRDRDAAIAAQVRELDPLLQGILAEFGDRALGRTFRGKQYGTRLEPPGQKPGVARGTIVTWGWHWHLYSYHKTRPGLELHPTFNEAGDLVAFTLSGGTWSEDCPPTEEGLKAGLVHAYQALYST